MSVRRAPDAAGDAEERVILVDEHDVPTGTLGKLAAHVDGARHRAVSVLLFHDDGSLLLQQRALGKYHSPGLWSNSCCGHPRPGESAVAAARRRLREELGLDASLAFAFTLAYRADVGGGLVEHEIDHVFVGRCTDVPTPDPSEVASWAWMSLDAIAADLEARPSRYTPWCALLVRSLLAGAGGALVDLLAPGAGASLPTRVAGG